MANGLLDDAPDPVSPLKAEIAQLEQTIAQLRQNQSQGGRGLLYGVPGGGGPQQISTPEIQQLYSTLAQYGNDPEQIGQQYVRALQAQQEQSRLTSPIEQMLRLYGPVNPGQFTPDSLAEFERNRLQGRLAYDVLVPRESLSTVEQKQILGASKRALDSESALGRMADLSNRFGAMAQTGVIKGRIPGGLRQWFTNSIGTQDELSALRTEYEQLVNAEVINNLPPGVASDRDIALARRGWPESVDDPAYIASFLRGMMKMQAIKHAQGAHEVRYISRTKDVSGIYDDWQANREWLIRDSLARYGGVTPAEGEPTTPTTPLAAPTTLLPPPTPDPTAPAPRTGTIKRPSREEVYRQYGFEPD